MATAFVSPTEPETVTLPQNVEAEAAMLGAMMIDNRLADDLVDRLLIYRAPIIVGGGRTLPDIGLADLSDAHGRWRLHDARALGSDRVEVYERG